MSSPTNKITISWLDTGSLANGSEKRLYYGTNEASLTSFIRATGTNVFASGAYYYVAEIAGLDPDTEYFFEIEKNPGNRKKIPSQKTFPMTMPASFKIAVVSDQHIDLNGAMNDPARMSDIEEQNPSALLIMGDIVTNGSSRNESIANQWIRFFKEYLSRLNADRMIPIFAVPGNHEVGNNTWQGTGNVSPSAGYFQLFFVNTKNIDPVGENYGQITISDYLQIIGLDTHSALPASQKTWLESAIDTNVDFVIPFFHSPLLPGSNRSPSDAGLQELLRNEWAELLAGAGNVSCYFTGHTHGRSVSVPWKIVDEKPLDDDFFQIGDKYIVTNTGSDIITEYGGGYRRQTYSFFDEWYNAINTNERQFYILEIDSEITVTEIKVGP